MITIAIKRAYEPEDRRDGKRVLVDRLWPRGVRKADLRLDDWWKGLAPSSELRKWFGHRPDRFEEFARRYRAELRKNPAVAATAASLKSGKVTLIYGAKDPQINHAIVLAEALRDKVRAAREKAKPVRDDALPA
jgi:uncharacterized protein YeaO (DUF488 family)